MPAGGVKITKKTTKRVITSETTDMAPEETVIHTTTTVEDNKENLG